MSMMRLVSHAEGVNIDDESILRLTGCSADLWLSHHVYMYVMYISDTCIQESCYMYIVLFIVAGMSFPLITLIQYMFMYLT